MNLCSKCYRELRIKEESHVTAKAFGEKNSILSPALFEKALSKEALSVCTPTMEGPQADVVSVSPLQLRTEPGAPSRSTVDMLKPVELIEGSGKTQQELDICETESVPAIAQQERSLGSTRCMSCRKRVGLLGFKCRCGGVFCAGHRYSDRHGCWFDYKAAGRDAIAKANPVVKAEKVGKI